MCRCAVIDGKRCCSQLEFMRAMGLDRLPYLCGGKPKRPSEMARHCLCPVDIKRAIHTAKATHLNPDDNSDDYVVETFRARMGREKQKKKGRCRRKPIDV